MKSKIFTLLAVASFFSVFPGNFLIAQSCCPPDSLIVTSATDSLFCVHWKITNSAHCDAPKSGQLEYRPVGINTWTRVTVSYAAGARYFRICDTATSCTKYIWRVRNICHDTTTTAWVSGPPFMTRCDTLDLRRRTAYTLHIYPNPAQSNVVIEGSATNRSKANLTVTDVNGTRKLQKDISSVNLFTIPVDISSWDKGIYFITISDGKKINAQYNFIKQ